MLNQCGVLFIENYIAGGSDQFALSLINNLPFKRLVVLTNKGNDTRILLQGELPPNVEVEKFKLLTVVELGLWANSISIPILRVLSKLFAFAIRYPLAIFSVLYFYLYLKRVGPNVFIANNGGYPGGFYCRTATISASLISGCRAVHVVHGLALPARGLIRFFEWAIDRILDRRARIVTVCRAVRARLKSTRAIRQEVSVIHNGIPNSFCLPTVYSSSIRILHIGYFDKNKNQRALIQSISQLSNADRSNVEMHFVGADSGDGSMALCRKLAMDLAVSQNIHFHGFISSPEHFYRNTDIFVLCSHSEGFPISILEAMRAGKAIIASDVGGVSEQIIDGVSGLLVPAGDTEVLAKKILRLKNDPDLRASLGAAARERYLTMFTLEKMVMEYTKIVELKDC